MDTSFWARFFGSKAAFAVFLACDAAFLFLYAPTLGVSAGEARIFFDDGGLLGRILRFSCDLLGQTTFAIRAPFVLMHLINTTLLYAVARERLRGSDAFLAAALFALLPGVNSAAILVSLAPFAIAGALIFVWLYDRSELAAYLALIAMPFCYKLFTALIFAAAINEIYRKRYRLAVFLSLFIAMIFLIYGASEFDNRPRGHFLEIFGLYGAIFSPLVFAFFLYSLYWYCVKNDRKLPLLWFVSAAPFGLSIALSLRQNLPIEDYAPFAAIATPLMIRAFMNSWRIRLPQFRARYEAAAAIVVFSLLLVGALTYFHKPLYALMSDSGKHFARNHHFIEELAARLKSRGMSAVESDRASLATRLKFYGIEDGGKYDLSEKPPKGKYETIEFTVLGSRAAVFYLSKK